jgi:hypothetical protein
MLEEVLPEGCTRVAGTDGRLIYLLQDNSGMYALHCVYKLLVLPLLMLLLPARISATCLLLVLLSSLRHCL